MTICLKSTKVLLQIIQRLHILKAIIEHLSDGKFELENKKSHLASMMGVNINMGLCAVLKNEKLTLLLTSIKTPPMDLGQLK